MADPADRGRADARRFGVTLALQQAVAAWTVGARADVIDQLREAHRKLVALAQLLGVDPAAIVEDSTR